MRERERRTPSVNLSRLQARSTPHASADSRRDNLLTSILVPSKLALRVRRCMLDTAENGKSAATYLPEREEGQQIVSRGIARNDLAEGVVIKSRRRFHLQVWGKGDVILELAAVTQLDDGVGSKRR